MSGEPLFVAGFERIMLEEATRAADAAARATTPRESGAKSLVSIVLAVAAVEALVGTWTAIFRDKYGIDKATLSTWRNRPINEVIKDILSRLKPSVAAESVAWYNPLCGIIKLRNHVAHYFPEFRVPGEWPTELAGVITGKV